MGGDPDAPSLDSGGASVRFSRLVSVHLSTLVHSIDKFNPSQSNPIQFDSARTTEKPAEFIESSTGRRDLAVRACRHPLVHFYAT